MTTLLADEALGLCVIEVWKSLSGWTTLDKSLLPQLFVGYHFLACLSRNMIFDWAWCSECVVQVALPCSCIHSDTWHRYTLLRACQEHLLKLWRGTWLYLLAAWAKPIFSVPCSLAEPCCCWSILLDTHLSLESPCLVELCHLLTTWWPGLFVLVVNTDSFFVDLRPYCGIVVERVLLHIELVLWFEPLFEFTVFVFEALGLDKVSKLINSI